MVSIYWNRDFYIIFFFSFSDWWCSYLHQCWRSVTSFENQALLQSPRAIYYFGVHARSHSVATETGNSRFGLRPKLVSVQKFRKRPKRTNFAAVHMAHVKTFIEAASSPKWQQLVLDEQASRGSQRKTIWKRIHQWSQHASEWTNSYVGDVISEQEDKRKTLQRSRFGRGLFQR